MLVKEPLEKAEISANPSSIIKIPDHFLAEILKPYKDYTKYLKSAEITGYLKEKPDQIEGKGESFFTGSGRFAIPESCYIDDTGHFNSVEFNICYNQIAYVLMGKCVDLGILQRFISDWDKKLKLSSENFTQLQLPSMFIVRIEGKFLKQLSSRNFLGSFSLDRISSAGKSYFFYTSISFSDSEGVKSKGKVLLAFNPPE